MARQIASALLRDPAAVDREDRRRSSVFPAPANSVIALRTSSRTRTTPSDSSQISCQSCAWNQRCTTDNGWYVSALPPYEKSARTITCVTAATCSTTATRTLGDSGNPVARNPKSSSRLISLPALLPTGLCEIDIASVDAASTRFSRRPKLSPGRLVSNVTARSALPSAASASSNSPASPKAPSMHSFRTASPDSSRAAASARSSTLQALGTVSHDFAAYSRSRTSASSCSFERGSTTASATSTSTRDLIAGAAAPARSNAATVSRRSVPLDAFRTESASRLRPFLNNSSDATS